MQSPDLKPHEDWQVWLQAGVTEEVDSALRHLYERISREIEVGPDEGERPTCQASGRCCKFEAFGHRLYVTGLEIAWFVRQLTSEQAEASVAESSGFELPHFSIPIMGADTPVSVPGACVHQIDGLCSTHTIRPLGCRVFFCDESSESWQHDLYEKYQAELRVLHDRLGIPYAYMEWRSGLTVGKQQAGLMP